MAQVIEGNSEAGFMFASIMEFIHLWKSGKESTMSLKCEDGKATINFKCSLGHPDQPHVHIKDGRGKRKIRVKSDIRKTRDNARAAAFQAAMASSPAASPGLSASSPTPTRTATRTKPSSTSKFRDANQEIWQSPISDSSRGRREDENNRENFSKNSIEEENYHENFSESENHHKSFSEEGNHHKNLSKDKSHHEDLNKDKSHHEDPSKDKSHHEDLSKDKSQHKDLNEDDSETEDRREGGTMPLQEIRDRLTILLKEITNPGPTDIQTYTSSRLEKVDSGTLLIDKVLEDLLRMIGKKPYEDNALSADSLLKKNIEILFPLIIKAEELRELRKANKSVGEILNWFFDN